MKSTRLIAVLLLFSVGLCAAQTPAVRYDTTQASIDKHPVPTWFNDAKLGIFIHWGLYSVPGWAKGTKKPLQEILAKTAGEEWFANNPYAEWYLNSLKIDGSSTQQHHKATYGDTFSYDDFVPVFNREIKQWNPDQWAKLFKDIGAKYVVLTTKHHDGFLLWPSRTPNPSKKNYQASRDIVGELSAAVTGQGLKMGLYYSSGLDWTFNPKTIKNFPDLFQATPQQSDYVAYLGNHWRELTERYNPAVLWADIGSPKAYNPVPVIAEFYNKNPEGVVNNRHTFEFAAPKAKPAVHYDFTTPEYQVLDTINTKKWETCRGIGLSFGYNQTEDAATFLSVDALVDSFVDIVSKNGNLLLNVGPEANGTIPEGQLSRLRGLGAWLKANGEAIYATRPWTQAAAKTTDGGRVRFTTKAGKLYMVLLDEPVGKRVTIADLPLGAVKTVTELSSGKPVKHTLTNRTLTLILPASQPKAVAYAFSLVE
ncbi:alpha-L-fucosidase [Fibrella aquatilis]|uniref:alpha-L-fucosidase n=1 Tax=Fibrella aquatilis TaxID=2817059 RepID=A0A939GAV0_9BACT|nr:alpha-L-fucosidase [Fibrella aquatilis]MBO0933854.1 alpha-L-fucosidase [Fibrella aquatilis]